MMEQYLLSSFCHAACCALPLIYESLLLASHHSFFIPVPQHSLRSFCWKGLYPLQAGD